jgi:hypothetical protein
VLKLAMLEDEIGRKLAEAERSGELKSAASYGKPMQEDTGWAQTPAELRMSFKILKDAGVVPPEVELLHERARLRDAVQAASSEGERSALQKKLSELEQKVALRLEALRVNASL